MKNIFHAKTKNKNTQKICRAPNKKCISLKKLLDANKQCNWRHTNAGREKILFFRQKILFERKKIVFFPKQNLLGEKKLCFFRSEDCWRQKTLLIGAQQMLDEKNTFLQNPAFFFGKNNFLDGRQWFYILQKNLFKVALAVFLTKNIFVRLQKKSKGNKYIFLAEIKFLRHIYK